MFAFHIYLSSGALMSNPSGPAPLLPREGLVSTFLELIRQLYIASCKQQIFPNLASQSFQQIPIYLREAVFVACTKYPNCTVAILSNGILKCNRCPGLCFIMVFKGKMAEHGDGQRHGLCHASMLDCPALSERSPFVKTVPHSRS